MLFLKLIFAAKIKCYVICCFAIYFWKKTVIFAINIYYSIVKITDKDCFVQYSLLLVFLFQKEKAFCWFAGFICLTFKSRCA
jgi:hypothetical protein